MPDLNYYLSLVSSWHSTRPKFMSVLAALIQPMVDAQAMLGKLTADFDLDTAIGVQLDMVGQWLGRSRYVTAPIDGVFFALDEPTERVGFDEGVWLGPLDQPSGVVALDDATYRLILYLQAAANIWDGTMPNMGELLDVVFPGVVVDDKGDTPDGLMTMDVLVPGPLVSTLFLQVLSQDFPMKPSGVLVNFIETTVVTEPIFGLDVDFDPDNPGPLAGFDDGAWGELILVL